MTDASATAEAPKLYYWNSYWGLEIEKCPCDVHFLAWLQREGITDKAIYHFGSGGHHLVGIECASPERRNAVLSITAAPQEHERYVELAIARPDVLRYYNCVFGDIYLINPDLLPEFDVVTLFHLCEFRGKETDAYGGLTDREVLERLAGRLRPGGHMLFYTGSFAYDWDGPNSAKDVAAAWAAGSDVEHVGRFESLDIYRKRG